MRIPQVLLVFALFLPSVPAVSSGSADDLGPPITASIETQCHVGRASHASVVLGVVTDLLSERCQRENEMLRAEGYPYCGANLCPESLETVTEPSHHLSVSATSYPATGEWRIAVRYAIQLDADEPTNGFIVNCVPVVSADTQLALVSELRKEEGVFDCFR